MTRRCTDCDTPIPNRDRHRETCRACVASRLGLHNHDRFYRLVMLAEDDKISDEEQVTLDRMLAERVASVRRARSDPRYSPPAHTRIAKLLSIPPSPSKPDDESDDDD